MSNCKKLSPNFLKDHENGDYWILFVSACMYCVYSAWLSDWESLEVARISDRASAVANLTLFTAEPMQVSLLVTSHSLMHQL